MKAIIVDDVVLDIQLIAKILEIECPEIKIVGTATTIAEAKQLILEQQLDIVFLDIQLERDGATIFKLLEELGKDKLTFEIVFITGYGEADYQTQAMQFAGLDFILKPVDRERLKAAVEKAQKRRGTDIYPQQIQLFTRLLEEAIRDFDKIAIPLSNGKGEIVFIKEILKIESDGNMAKIYMLEQSKPLMSSKSLGFYEKQLTEHHFYRIHDCVLLNLQYVSRWDGREYALKLKNGMTEFGARRRWKEIQAALEKMHQSPMLNWLNRFFGKT